MVDRPSSAPRLRALWILTIALLCGALRAQDPPLRVGTKLAAPFVMEGDGGGSLQGLSIELWNRVAQRLDRPTTAPEVVSLQDLIDGLNGDDRKDRRFDVAVAALTVNAEREKGMDFTHGFLTAGPAIAIRDTGSSGFWLVIDRVFSIELLEAIGALVVVLAICGGVVWLFERRANPEQFGGSTGRGIGEGFWWAAVTMTTVGYGDRAPVTRGGRLVALVWMFASIIVISSYTASIASALTVSRLASDIQGVRDLPGKRLGTVNASTSALWLDGQRNLAYDGFETLEAAVAALADGRLDAVIYDEPLLRYLTTGPYEGRVAVLPGLLRKEQYAFGLPNGSDALKEGINLHLLEILDSAEWSDLVAQYLGS